MGIAVALATDELNGCWQVVLLSGSNDCYLSIKLLFLILATRPRACAVGSIHMQVDISAASSVASTTSTLYFSVDLLLGAVFVLFYAGTRFNTPSTNRSSTTAGRYFVGLFLYCLVGICFYVTLVAFPNFLDFALFGQQMGGDAPTSSISLPLFVALLLTVLLPKILLSGLAK